MKFNWKKIARPIIGLSPMADMTDSAYGKIVRGVMDCTQTPVIFREMVSSEAIVRENKKTQEMSKIADIERPLIQQIFGADPQVMAKCAAIIENDFHPEGIDINMGCPVYKMVSNFNGAALMKNPRLAESIVKEIKKTISIPVSVKIRAGWSDHFECIDFARRLEQAGADMISVHGRTQAQGYRGAANRNVVREVKNSLSIPVLYNGDIFTYQDYFEALEQTHCDGALIARGALGNPWIFKQIQDVLAKKPPIEITLAQRIQMVQKHLIVHLAQYGESAVPAFRKHISWYFKGLTDFKLYREKLMSARTALELNDVLLAIDIKTHS